MVVQELAPLVESRPGDVSEISYRPVSMLAVVGCLLGVLSLCGLFVWFLLFLPLFSILMSSLAILAIRRSEGELTGRGLSFAGIFLSVVSLCGGISYQSYLYANEVPPGYERLSFVDDISRKGIRQGMNVRSFEDMIHPDVLALDGKKLYLKGFVYPVSDPKMTGFLLLKDSGNCCFGGKPPITDRIGVTMKEGLVANYVACRFSVGGTFHINKNFQGGDLEPLYTIEADFAGPAHTDF